MGYNLHDILTDGNQRFKGHEYIFEKIDNTFQGKTYDQFVNDVQNTAKVLISQGLNNKKIIIYGSNSYNYMVTDTAVMGYVGISCTISKEWSAYELKKATEFLDASAVIYSSQKSNSINILKENFPDIQYIMLEDILTLSSNEVDLNAQSSDVCCKIIFSSGTTGNPKAVMLTQKNMFACWDSLKKRTPFTPEDKDYLFLPLSHTYGGICNFMYSMISGMSIYICSDTKLIMEEIQTVKPTVFCAVPLIYEKIYSACMEKNIPPKAIFGGNMKYLFNGGAYLKCEIRKFLKESGLNLLEAYGLTETSSLISCEYTDYEDFCSVGTVLENMEIRINQPNQDGIGEITVCGENIFKEYYNNTSATSKAFEDNGFFHTGDLGFIKDNKLHLIGRKRRMILLSNGENIYPDEIEKLFEEYPQINRVKVYDDNGMVSATIYENSNCDTETIIEEVNNKLPKYSQIKNFKSINDSIDTRLK